MFASALLLALCPPVQATSDFNLQTRTGNPGAPAEYAWDGKEKVLTVKDGANITVTGAVTDGSHIEVATGAKATITFEDVSISGLDSDSRTARQAARSRLKVRGMLHELIGISDKADSSVDIGLGPNQSPLTLNRDAKATLELRGTNALTAGDCGITKFTYCSGIEVRGGATLTIDGTGALTATGSRYTFDGSNGTGIGTSQYWNGCGSNSRNSCGDGGTIIISGGTVTVNGGISASDSGTITISGGTVTADYINNARGGVIAINNGTVTSESGIRITRGGAITISGGTVTANGTIGGDADRAMDAASSGRDLAITISGGTVTANGKGENAGIGGRINTNMYGTDGIIIINITGDADVTAKGGDGNTLGDSSGGGAGIGGGGSEYTGEIGVIKIDTTGTVNAIGGKGFKGGSGGANIGQGGGSKDKYSTEVSTGAGIGHFSSQPSPASASVTAGGAASFSCNVTPMPDAPAPKFSWSWQFYSGAAHSSWTTVRGATAATLNLPSVTPEMTGQYRCEVLVTDFPRGGRFKGDAEEKRNAPPSSIRYVSRAATLTVRAK